MVVVVVLKLGKCWKKSFLFSSENSKRKLLGSSDREDPAEFDLGLAWF